MFHHYLCHPTITTHIQLLKFRNIHFLLFASVRFTTALSHLVSVGDCSHLLFILSLSTYPGVPLLLPGSFNAVVYSLFSLIFSSLPVALSASFLVSLFISPSVIPLLFLVTFCKSVSLPCFSGTFSFSNKDWDIHCLTSPPPSVVLHLGPLFADCNISFNNDFTKGYEIINNHRKIREIQVLGHKSFNHVKNTCKIVLGSAHTLHIHLVRLLFFGHIVTEMVFLFEITSPEDKTDRPSLTAKTWNTQMNMKKNQCIVFGVHCFFMQLSINMGPNANCQGCVFELVVDFRHPNICSRAQKGIFPQYVPFRNDCCSE